MNLTVDGITKSVPEWARDTRLNANTIYGRIKRGWSAREAVSTNVSLKSIGLGMLRRIPSRELYRYRLAALTRNAKREARFERVSAGACGENECLTCGGELLYRLPVYDRDTFVGSVCSWRCRYGGTPTMKRTLLLAVLLAWAASADTVNSTGGNFYSGWTANTDGAEFWDNSSYDGRGCNIGYWLTATQGSCANLAPGSVITPAGAWDYLGAGDRDTNVSGFTFTPGAGTVNTALQVEVAGLRDSNIFGWYLVSDPSTLHPLFFGSDAPQLSAAFTPGGEYGFYLERGDGVKFRSGLDAYQHFALFLNLHSGTNLSEYFIGVEDLRPRGDPLSPDLDFQDLVVHVVVPEPGFFGVMGLALAGLVVGYRFGRAETTDVRN